MDEKLFRKIRIINAWFIIALMLCLFFCYYIPWFSVDQNYPVEDNLYFNLDMMKKSTNEEIIDISEKINFLIISIWIILIFSLFSQLGLSIYIAPDYDAIGLLFILSGSLITVISSFIAFIYNYVIINGINNLTLAVRGSYVLPNINYYYIPLFIIVFVMIISIYYTILVAPSCLNHLRKSEIEEDKKIREEASKIQNEKIQLGKPKFNEPIKHEKEINFPSGFKANEFNDSLDEKRNILETEDKENYSKKSNEEFFQKDNKNIKTIDEEKKPFFAQIEKNISEKEKLDEKNEFRSPVVDKQTQDQYIEKKIEKKDKFDLQLITTNDTQNSFDRSEKTKEDLGFEFEEEDEDKEQININSSKENRSVEKKEIVTPKQNQGSIWGNEIEIKKKTYNEDIKNNTNEIKESNDESMKAVSSFEDAFLSKFEKRRNERKKERSSSDTFEQKDSLNEKNMDNDIQEKASEDRERKQSFSKEQAKSEIIKFLEENRTTVNKEEDIDQPIQMKKNNEDKPDLDSTKIDKEVEKTNVASQIQTTEEEVVQKPTNADENQTQEDNITKEGSVEEEIIIDVLTVRCPKCTNEFEVETSSKENTIHINCPKCGESGVLKK